MKALGWDSNKNGKRYSTQIITKENWGWGSCPNIRQDRHKYLLQETKKDIIYFKRAKQLDITIIHIYAPNNRAPNSIKQKLTELGGEIAL